MLVPEPELVDGEFHLVLRRKGGKRDRVQIDEPIPEREQREKASVWPSGETERR